MKKEASAKTFAHLTKDEKIKRNKKKATSSEKTQRLGNKKRCASSAGTKEKKTEQQNKIQSPVFPPPPLTKELGETIIRQWCKESQPSSLEESGCAVCGELVPISQLSRLKNIKKMLGILTAPGVTRTEHKSASQKISDFQGPVLD